MPPRFQESNKEAPKFAFERFEELMGECMKLVNSKECDELSQGPSNQAPQGGYTTTAGDCGQTPCIDDNNTCTVTVPDLSQPPDNSGDPPPTITIEVDLNPPPPPPPPEPENFADNIANALEVSGQVLDVGGKLLVAYGVIFAPENPPAAGLTALGAALVLEGALKQEGAKLVRRFYGSKQKYCPAIQLGEEFIGYIDPDPNDGGQLTEEDFEDACLCSIGEALFTPQFELPYLPDLDTEKFARRLGGICVGKEKRDRLWCVVNPGGPVGPLDKPRPDCTMALVEDHGDLTSYELSALCKKVQCPETQVALARQDKSGLVTCDCVSVEWKKQTSGDGQIQTVKCDAIDCPKGTSCQPNPDPDQSTPICVGPQSPDGIGGLEGPRPVPPRPGPIGPRLPQ
jgi:hypothetical protein